MRKNITQFIVAMVLCALALPINAQSIGHRFQVDGIFYEVTSTSPMEVSAVPQLGNYPFWKDAPMPEGDIVIPATVTNEGHTYSVTGVGEALFYQCVGLTSSTLPASITSIGNMAYMNCTKITEITIPDGVTAIGSSAFNVCTSLSSVTFPTSLTSIGASAFYKTNLTEVVLPNSVTTIGNLAFSMCPALVSVTIPASVQSIGESAFNKSQQLKTVHLSEGLKTIGRSAFGECDALTSIVIPNSTTTIGETAFEYCTGLKTVTIPRSLTSIGGWAFADCSSLERIDSYLEDVSAATLSSGVFEGSSTSTCVLSVPSGTLAAYQAAEQWKDFGTIQERVSSDVRDVLSRNATFSVRKVGSELIVEVPETLLSEQASAVRLINLLGKAVETYPLAKQVSFDTSDLTKGVYLIQVGDAIEKIVIR